MEHIWTVVCEKSIVDSSSNNISLINVIERIRFGEREELKGDKMVPGAFVGLEVVSMWCRSDVEKPETGKSRTEFLSPSKDVLVGNEGPIDLMEHQRLRAIWAFFGVPYAGDGRYMFVVQQEVDGEWQTEAEIPLEISKIPSED